MKLVRFASAVIYPDRLKSGVVKIIDTADLGDFCTEATTAKQSINPIHGTIVGDFIAGSVFAAPFAMDFCHNYHLKWLAANRAILQPTQCEVCNVGMQKYRGFVSCDFDTKKA